MPESRDRTSWEVGRVKSLPETRLEQLALLLTSMWALGATASHWVGLWWGISGIALLCGALAVLRERRLLLERLRPAIGLVLLGLAGSVVMVAATYGLYPVAGRLVVSLPAETAALYALLGRIPLAVSLPLLPLVIVSEELVWRGVVQEALARRFGVLWSIPLAAGAYALAHAPAGNALLALLCVACGLFWSALRARSGSVLVPLITHLVWDALVFVLAPLVRP